MTLLRMRAYDLDSVNASRNTPGRQTIAHRQRQARIFDRRHHAHLPGIGGLKGPLQPRHGREIEQRVEQALFERSGCLQERIVARHFGQRPQLPSVFSSKQTFNVRSASGLSARKRIFSQRVASAPWWTISVRSVDHSRSRRGWSLQAGGTGRSASPVSAPDARRGRVRCSPARRFGNSPNAGSARCGAGGWSRR